MEDDGRERRRTERVELSAREGGECASSTSSRIRLFSEIVIVIVIRIVKVLFRE